MEQGLGEERAARMETSSQCKVSWSARAQGPGESERRGGLPRISLFRGARNLEYLPPPPPPPICRGEGCVVNISPPVFLTYSPPRGRRNPRGRVTAGMQVKHWQCHIAFPFLLCTDLFVFPWTGNDLLKMYFIHPPTWSWFFLFYSPDLVNDIDSFSNVKLTLLPRTNPTVSDGWSFLYTANIHLYTISIYDLK